MGGGRGWEWEGEGPRALIVCFGRKKKQEKEQKIYITLENKSLLVSYSVLALLTWPEVEVLVPRGQLGKQRLLNPRGASFRPCRAGLPGGAENWSGPQVPRPLLKGSKSLPTGEPGDQRGTEGKD